MKPSKMFDQTRPTLASVALATALCLQAGLVAAQGSLPANFSLPSVPKTAEFNVPLNFSDLPPAYYKELKVLCAVYESPEPPFFGAPQLAGGGSERVNVVNGAYNGVLKVKVLVNATDVAKVKSWRCQVFASGPGLSDQNIGVQDIPDGAKPAPGTPTKTGASGKYN